MPYAIQTRDDPAKAALRVQLRPEHVAYLKANLKLLLAGGALLDDAGSNGFGGIILLDTDERAVAEAFVAADPYTQGGLFESVTVSRWRKAFFNGQSLL